MVYSTAIWVLQYHSDLNWECWTVQQCALLDKMYGDCIPRKSGVPGQSLVLMYVKWRHSAISSKLFAQNSSLVLCRSKAIICCWNQAHVPGKLPDWRQPDTVRRNTSYDRFAWLQYFIRQNLRHGRSFQLHVYFDSLIGFHGWLYVFLYTCLPVHLSICASVCPCLPGCKFVALFISVTFMCLSVCLYVRMSVCLFVCVFVFVSFFLSNCLFVCLSVCLPDIPPIYLFAFLCELPTGILERKTFRALYVSRYTFCRCKCSFGYFVLSLCVCLRRLSTRGPIHFLKTKRTSPMSVRQTKCKNSDLILFWKGGLRKTLIQNMRT